MRGRLLNQPESLAYPQVEAFLERGASPSQMQNGATALLLVILNPYSLMQDPMRLRFSKLLPLLLLLLLLLSLLHISEPTILRRTSSAVFCLQKQSYLRPSP